MTGETPPGKGRSGADAAMTKISIGLIVVVALIGLIAAGTAGSSSSNVLLLGAATPTKVTVPSIDASSDLIALGTKSNGELEVPPLSDPMQASWYDGSPSPGALGPSVILGHVNGGGRPGIFAKLTDVKAGEEITVDRADGQTAVFTVSHVDTVPKEAFPADEVYGDTPDSQLRLITCGGIFDPAADSYEANVVVYANLTAVRQTAA